MIFDDLTEEQEAVLDDIWKRCRAAGIVPQEFWTKDGTSIEPSGRAWVEAAARMLGAEQPWLIWYWPVERVLTNDPYIRDDDEETARRANAWLPEMPT